MIVYQQLRPDQTADYASMTYAKYQPYLAQEANDYVRFTCFGASLENKPVGLLLGQISHKNQQAVLLSLYTAAPMRNQGVATGLVGAYETWLREQTSPIVSATYTTMTKSLPIVERVLSKNGWDAPEALNSAVYIPTKLAAYQRFIQAPMGQFGCDLPEGYHYADWLSIPSELKEALRTRIEGVVPPDESPFVIDHTPIDPSSVAILYDGQIIAWLINHRVAPKRLRFSILYLDAEHRGHKLGIKLINEAIRRAHLHFDPEHQETFFFQTRLENSVMQAYIQAIGLVISHIEELRLMKKDLT